MNEKKKMWILLVGLLVVAVIVITAMVSEELKAKKYVEKVNDAIDGKEASLLYLGKPTCGYCNLLTPVLKNYKDTYKFDYLYINIEDISASKMDVIYDKLKIDSNSFGTPYLAVVKDGKKVAEQKGYVPEDQLFNFLKDNGFIGKDEKLALNYIDYNAYKEMIDKGDRELFVFVQTGCSYCEEAKPVLEQLAKQYNIKINVLNIGNIESDEQKSEFNESLSYLKDKEWGTPLTLVVENKEVKADKSGFDSKENYIQFLKDNGFIKE